ncbi:hypothetical protein [Amycolatopsis jiangsuensis]|uniref:Uncharacterized protein n=1 Tax=Amycolatopsis jiangsuensis TaxID=1181879 RepID=A0A840J782_9PSEU|nr:hypothetical protein [Amycolatopsis jiangsuensis]MBB4689284.1 hypothetical protein [Amycolatopsis jiangsuensis]
MPSRADASQQEGIMRTTVKSLPVTAVGLIVAGDLLLATGALMAIAEPSGPGVNFGAIGFLFLGWCAAGAGLLAGIAAAVVRLRRRGGQHPPAQLLPWEKRLRLSTVAAIGLSTIGAAVLGAGPLFFRGPRGSGFESDIPVFLVGLCISATALLAGIPPTLYRWSKRRTGVERFS